MRKNFRFYSMVTEEPDSVTIHNSPLTASYILVVVLKEVALFVAQGGHGIETTGAEGGDVAGGRSDKGKCGGG